MTMPGGDMRDPGDGDDDAAVRGKHVRGVIPGGGVTGSRPDAVHDEHQGADERDRLDGPGPVRLMAGDAEGHHDRYHPDDDVGDAASDAAWRRAPASQASPPTMSRPTRPPPQRHSQTTATHEYRQEDRAQGRSGQRLRHETVGRLTGNRRLRARAAETRPRARLSARPHPGRRVHGRWRLSTADINACGDSSTCSGSLNESRRWAGRARSPLRAALMGGAHRRLAAETIAVPPGSGPRSGNRPGRPGRPDLAVPVPHTAVGNHEPWGFGAPAPPRRPGWRRGVA
jgi:hypothetical protein